MTPAQLSHLRAIFDHCGRQLEIEKRRTQGRWIRDGYVIKQPAGRICADVGPHHTPPDEYPKSCKRADEQNGDFIVSAANNMRPLLKATRAAIASILNCPYCGGTGMTKGWVPTYADPDNASLAKEAEPCCEHAKDILAAFPLESLNS